MSDIIAQFWTPEMQAAFTMVVVLLVILYILSVVWVARDAYMRGSYWYIWAIVALVPFIGALAYCLLRPPLLEIDRDEQELEIALKQRQLMQYGECANCGYPVEADYVICPNCRQRLKNLCSVCHHALDPTWTVCPYCASNVGASGGHRRRSHAAPRRRQQGNNLQSSDTRTSQQSSRLQVSRRAAQPQHVSPTSPDASSVQQNEDDQVKSDVTPIPQPVQNDSYEQTPNTDTVSST